MEIVIGVEFNPRELRLESKEDIDDVRRRVEEALGAGQGMLWLSDDKGRHVGVPVAKLAYVELDPGGDSKKVGFGPA